MTKVGSGGSERCQPADEISADRAATRLGLSFPAPPGKTPATTEITSCDAGLALGEPLNGKRWSSGAD